MGPRNVSEPYNISIDEATDIMNKCFYWKRIGLTWIYRDCPVPDQMTLQNCPKKGGIRIQGHEHLVKKVIDEFDKVYGRPVSTYIDSKSGRCWWYVEDCIWDWCEMIDER